MWTLQVNQKQPSNTIMNTSPNTQEQKERLARTIHNANVITWQGLDPFEYARADSELATMLLRTSVVFEHMMKHRRYIEQFIESGMTFASPVSFGLSACTLTDPHALVQHFRETITEDRRKWAEERATVDREIARRQAEEREATERRRAEREAAYLAEVAERRAKEREAAEAQ